MYAGISTLRALANDLDRLGPCRTTFEAMELIPLDEVLAAPHCAVIGNDRPRPSTSWWTPTLNLPGP